jgi:hypothetical protein
MTQVPFISVTGQEMDVVLPPLLITHDHQWLKLMKISLETKFSQRKMLKNEH